MTGTARFLVRHRGPLVAAVAVAASLAGWRAWRLELDFSFRPFFLEDDQDQLSTALAQRFPDAGAAHLAAVLETDDAFRPELLTAIERMGEEIARIAEPRRAGRGDAAGASAVPAVTRVYSLSRTVVAVPEGAELPLPRTVQHHLEAYAQLPPDVRAARLAGLRERMLEDDLYADRIVSKDGTSTLIVGVLAGRHPGSWARQQIIEHFEAAVTRNLAGLAGTTARFTGYPVAEAEYRRLISRGFVIAQVVGVALIATGLFVCFRTVVAVILPLLVIGVATVLTLGFMEVTGQRVTIIHASAPLLLLVVGIAELGFFMARYHEEAARPGVSPEEAAVCATARVLPPGFMGLATTSLGFLSLAASRIPLTRDFGLTMAFGIMAIFLVGTALVPGTLSLVALPRRRVGAVGRLATTATRLLAVVADVVVRRRWIVVVGTAAVALLGLAGMVLIHVEQFVTRELPEGNPVRTAARVVDEKFGGAFPTWVGVRTRDGGSVLRSAVLADIEALQRFLGEQVARGVLRTTSMADYLKELNMLANEGRPHFRRLPDDGRLNNLFAQQLAGAGDSGDVGLLIGPSDHLAMIVVGMGDIGAAGLLDLHEATQNYARGALGDRLEVGFLGDYWRASLGIQSLVRDLVASVLSSFVLVFGLVAVFFRSVRLTLVSIPSNLVPLAAAVGLMGLGGISLRVGPSIILPITLGIAVTATVHCLVRLREEWQRTPDYASAVRRSLGATGRAMLFADGVLVLGFLALLIPEFLAFRHTAILGSFTLFTALLGDLFLLPTLVLWTRPFGDEVRATLPVPVGRNGHAVEPRRGAPVRNGQAAEPRPAFRVSGTFGPFLASTRYCDCGHPSILAMASMLCAEGGSERAIAVRLFRFVRDHVEYAFTPWGVSASTTLAWRRGTCSNKNNLLVALLRAAGVPAAYGVLRVNAREYFGNLAPPFLKPFASVTSTHIYAAAHLGGRWVKCDASTDREIAGKTAHFCRQTQLVEWDGIHDAQEFLDPSHIHQDLGLRPVVDDLLAKQPRNATAALFAILNDYLQFIRAEAAFASAEELLDAYVRAPARGELRP